MSDSNNPNSSPEQPLNEPKDAASEHLPVVEKVISPNACSSVPDDDYEQQLLLNNPIDRPWVKTFIALYAKGMRRGAAAIEAKRIWNLDLTDSTMQCYASQWLQDPEVVQAIKDKRLQVSSAAEVDKDWQIENLKNDIKTCTDARARKGMEELLAKMTGTTDTVIDKRLADLSSVTLPQINIVLPPKPE